jgi:hypothetical protein
VAKIKQIKLWFAECPQKALGKDFLCRVSTIWHSAKRVFTECLLWTLGKESRTHLCRVSVSWHSAKCLRRVPAIWHSAKNILKLKKLYRVPDRGHSAKIKNIIAARDSFSFFLSSHSLSLSLPRLTLRRHAPRRLTLCPSLPHPVRPRPRRLTPRCRATPPLPRPAAHLSPTPPRPAACLAPLPAPPSVATPLHRRPVAPPRRRARALHRGAPSTLSTKVHTHFELFVAKYYEIEVCLLWNRVRYFLCVIVYCEIEGK